MSDIIPGKRQREDDIFIQWKLALLDGSFAPFLIQDVTPRYRRIATDPALTTHPNGAVGLRGVEIMVRDMAAAKERYTTLWHMATPVETASEYTIECVTLHETVEAKYSETLSAVYLVFE